MSLPHQPWEERGTDTPNLATRRSDNSTPLIQLQRERVRHHQELHHLDQQVGERLYGSGTRPYMSYMDDVIPVRVNPTLPLGLSPKWDPRPRALVAITEEEIFSPHPVPPAEELPTYDEVMQNETMYHSVYHEAALGALGFLEDSSPISDSDSIHEGMYQLQDQPRDRDYGYNQPKNH